MGNIEEFTLEGRNFVYIDLSDLTSTSKFREISVEIKSVIAKHPKNSLYTITNIKNTKLDSESKNIMVDYMEHNKPYVRHGVLIGMDGIKKVMALSMFKMVGRKNYSFAFSKEQAIERLLRHEIDDQEDKDGN